MNRKEFLYNSGLLLVGGSSLIKFALSNAANASPIIREHTGTRLCLQSNFLHYSPQMSEINNDPMIQEAALRYFLPSFEEPDAPGQLSVGAIEALDIKPDTPFFLHSNGSRPPYLCMRDYHFDKTANEDWKKRHPDFIDFIGGREWDNEFRHVLKGTAIQHLERRKAPAIVITNVQKELPQPQNRMEALEELHKCYQSVQGYCFDDRSKQNFMRSGWSVDHQSYEWGADMAWVETTNTGPYRYQIALSFIRGAARQYHKKWGWYIALCYNAYDDEGNRSVNNTPYYTSTKSVIDNGNGDVLGPGYGVSASLAKRTYYLAYLNGASFVEPEVFPYAYFQYNPNDPGKWGLSPYGEVMQEWYQCVKRHPDVGSSYAPITLLVPFEQGYSQWGGPSWSVFPYERTDYMIDAFMYTLVPYSPVTKEGNEGCLSNSTYGDIFDVITPNPPQNTVALDALQRYKVAVLLGKYEQNAELVQRLMQYVKSGGTLLLNIKQVNNLFPESFLGFGEIGGNSTVQGNIRSLVDNKEYHLDEEYEYQKVKLRTAKPLMTDAGGNVMACVQQYGKGRLITTLVDYMLPKKDLTGKSVDPMLASMSTGKKFPFVAALMEPIVREVMPIEISGDVEYGLNELKNGWLIYLINNKGVVKFTNKPQQLDESQTAIVTVKLKGTQATSVKDWRTEKVLSLGGDKSTFTVDVPPGDIRVVEVRC